MISIQYNLKFQSALLQKWVFPLVMCKIGPFASTLSVNVSITTLIALSIDRYYVKILILRIFFK